MIEHNDAIELQMIDARLRIYKICIIAFSILCASLFITSLYIVR